VRSTAQDTQLLVTSSTGKHIKKSNTSSDCDEDDERVKIAASKTGGRGSKRGRMEAEDEDDAESDYEVRESCPQVFTCAPCTHALYWHAALFDCSDQHHNGMFEQ